MALRGNCLVWALYWRLTRGGRLCVERSPHLAVCPRFYWYGDGATLAFVPNDPPENAWRLFFSAIWFEGHIRGRVVPARRAERLDESLVVAMWRAMRGRHREHRMG